MAAAFEMGWAEFGNGDLLLEAEAEFNALILASVRAFLVLSLRISLANQGNELIRS